MLRQHLNPRQESTRETRARASCARAVGSDARSAIQLCHHAINAEGDTATLDLIRAATRLRRALALVECEAARRQTAP